jgi:peroxidase
MNLATREAVMHFNVPGYAVPLGLKDSLAPADLARIWELPGPDLSAAELLQRFATRGFDVADVVVLSGAHTIGRSSCGGFQDRFQESTGFARRLRANCSSDANRLQDLDVTTPIVFDNKYFSNLLEGKGLFTSDQVLATDGRTQWAVQGLAQNKWWFYSQFRDSLVKLSQFQPNGNVGEIRSKSCFVTNGQSSQLEEGFAASA